MREGECQPLASCTPIKQPLGEAWRGCERGSAPWGHAGAYLVAPHPVARVHDERFPTVVVLTDIQAAFGALIFNLQGEKKIIIIRTGRADGATLGAGVAGHLNIAVQTRCWHRCQVRVPRPFQDTRNARGSASSPRLRARAARPKFQEIEADLNPGGSQRRALGGHVTTLSFPAAGPTSPRNYTHTQTIGCQLGVGDFWQLPPRRQGQCLTSCPSPSASSLGTAHLFFWGPPVNAQS